MDNNIISGALPFITSLKLFITHGSYHMLPGKSTQPYFVDLSIFIHYIFATKKKHGLLNRFLLIYKIISSTRHINFKTLLHQKILLSTNTPFSYSQYNNHTKLEDTKSWIMQSETPPQ